MKPESRLSRTPVLIWDLPTRAFHWLLVVCFAGAYVSSEWDDWRLLHATLGATAGGLIVFRAIWGLVGTRHARFADFVYGREAVIRDLSSLLRRRPQHHAGHPPAGSWAIFALLALGLVTALTGYAHLNEIGGEFVEEIHELFANAMLAVVVVHVGGVIVASLVHGENLVRAMVTGRKLAEPADAIRSPLRWVAVALLAVVAAFWINAFGVRDALLGPAQQFAERGHSGDVTDDD